MTIRAESGKAVLIVILSIVGLCVVGGGVVGIGFALMWDGVPPGWKMEDHPPGTQLKFPKLNYSFAVPYAPWIRIQPRRINGLASVAYTQGKNQVYFMVIAEALDPELDITDELLVQVVKNNMKQATRSARFSPPEPETLHALDGTRLEAQANTTGFKAHLRYWIGTVNGYVYQLVVWGPQKDRDYVNEQAEGIFRNFEILDYTRSAGDP